MKKSIVETIEEEVVRENKESKMISEYRKRIKGKKIHASHVKGCPNNTVFYTFDKEKGEKAVSNFEREHKKFWR